MIAHETIGAGIEVELSFQPVRDVSQQTETRREVVGISFSYKKRARAKEFPEKLCRRAGVPSWEPGPMAVGGRMHVRLAQPISPPARSL